MPSSDNTRRSSRPRAFTLVELIVVIVVLAILAGVAVPKYFDYAERARISKAQGARGALNTAVQGARLQAITLNPALAANNGGWPADLTNIFDAGGDDKHLNPWLPANTAVYVIDTANNPNKWHPQTKHIQAGTGSGSGSIWYNPRNGALRYRVKNMGNNAATLALYNEVNDCKVTTINYTGSQY